MRNKIKLAVLSVAMAVLAPGMLVFADGHSVVVESSVTIPQNGQASLKHVITTRNTDKQSLPGIVSFNLSGQDIARLSVKDSQGNALKTSIGESETSLEIAIPEARRKQKGQWSFTVSYNSGLVHNYALTKAAQITAIKTNLPVTKHTMRVSADLDLGFASVRGPKPKSTAIGVGQQQLTFSNTKSQIEASPILLFGEGVVADLNFSSQLSNDSFWWKDVALTLPPDTNQQQVVLRSITPTPKNVQLDRDGNILAVYRLGPRQSVDVTAVMQLKLDVFDYKLSGAGSVESTPQMLVERYTAQTEHWQPMGFDVKTDGSDAAALVKAVFDQVVARAKDDTENQQLQLASRGGALRYSDWLVGELRSRGVPARIVVGLLDSDGERLLEQPRAHAWAEAYINGTGWVTLDPWLSLRTGGFTGSDPLHVAVGLWGIEQDRPPVVLEGISLSFVDESFEPAAASEGSVLSATKQVWLPFISTLSIEARLPDGRITDGVVVRVDGEDISLGSLAPMQNTRLRFARVGSAAFSNEPVVLGQSTGDFTAWQEIQSQTSYIPLAAVSAILIVITGLWWWRRQKKSPTPKSGRKNRQLQSDAPGENIEAQDLVVTEPPAPSSPAPIPPPLPPSPSAIHQQPVARRVNNQPRPHRPDRYQSATMKRNEHMLRSRQLIQ